MPKKEDQIINPTNSGQEAVPDTAKSLVGPTPKHEEINKMNEKRGDLGPPTQPSHQPLFHVEKQTEIDGVEMGVLENGIPYLTESGLARMCGIDRKVLNRLAIGWADEQNKPRGKQISQLLEQGGYGEGGLFLESEHRGSKINAYTEPVCLALLEYYAFVAEDQRPEAIRAFRALARTTFRKFIYDAVGYSPEHAALDRWRHFHDRVDMTHDAAPLGFWGVFKEIAVMIVPMIRAGLIISDRVVPDISVGKAWSEYWKENNLSNQYGDRTKYDHEYPEYYPQAKSNPQPSYAYPNAALGLFRDWLYTNYILTKFPKYMLGQAIKGTINLPIANRAIEAFGGQRLDYKPRPKLHDRKTSN